MYIFADAEQNANIVYDGSSLTDADKERAIIIDTLPEKSIFIGKNTAILKANKETGQVWWEYVLLNNNPIISKHTVEEHLTAIEAAILEIMG